MAEASSAASDEGTRKEDTTAPPGGAPAPGRVDGDEHAKESADRSTAETDGAAEDSPSESHDLEKQRTPDKSDTDRPAPPPVDKGLQAWLNVLGGFCALFVSFGWITAMGVFQQAYQTTILSSYSPSTISWILSLQAFMMYFNGFWVGLLTDNYGPRPVVAVGSVFHVAGILGASFGTQYWHFILCQGIISPIGAAAVFYPALSTIVTWFDKRRGLALGINASGASLGGVIFPIMVQELIPRVGFGWSMRAADLLIIVLLIISNLTIKPRMGPSPRRFTPKAFVAPLGERHFFILTLGAFLVYFGFFIPYDYLPVQALNAGVDARLTSYIVPIMNGASVFGRITPAWAADRLGRSNVNLVMTALCAVFTLALWLPARTSTAGIIVYAAAYGFVTGAFVAILAALIAQISPDLRAIGSRTGTLFATISFATLAGNPIAGALLGPHRDNYTPLIIFSGVLLAAGTVVLAILRMQLSGGKLWYKV